MTSTTAKPLKVIIVGAGLGGLAAGLGLRRQGHEVHFVEKSHFANEIGAAVSASPNMNAILRRLGVFLEDAGACDLTGYAQLDKDGKLVGAVDHGTEAKAKFGNPHLAAHRAHMHRQLKEAATGAAGEGTPCTLRLASPVKSVDAENATVTLANGETLSGDVVIGADGVHSVTRYSLPGSQGIEPFSSGFCGWRFLLDRKAMRQSPAFSELDKMDGTLVAFRADAGHTMVMYSCVNNTIMNCMAICRSDELGYSPGQDWHNIANKDHMLEIFKGSFGAAPLAVLEMVDASQLKLWELMDMAELPTWTHERLATLGDAAHPFTPWRGQGAAMAIEDAASIAALLPLGTSPAEVPARFKLYEKCRRERALKIQDESRKAANGTVVNVDPDGTVRSQILETEKQLFGYDEWEHSTKMLQESMSQ